MAVFAFLAAERSCLELLVKGAYAVVFLATEKLVGTCIVREKFFVGVARAGLLIELSLLAIVARAGLFDSLFIPMVPDIPMTLFLRTLGDFWSELRNLSINVGGYEATGLSYSPKPKT